MKKTEIYFYAIQLNFYNTLGDIEDSLFLDTTMRTFNDARLAAEAYDIRDDEGISVCKVDGLGHIFASWVIK